LLVHIPAYPYGCRLAQNFFPIGASAMQAVAVKRTLPHGKSGHVLTERRGKWQVEVVAFSVNQDASQRAVRICSSLEFSLQSHNPGKLQQA